MNRLLLILRWLSLGFLALMSALAVVPARAADAPPLDDPTHFLSQYKIDLWQTEQGLPLNTVQTLLQTRDGKLWVGTAGGLARFDGVRFKTFSGTEAPFMASEPVFGLMQDRDGALWIGHSKGAAVYRDGRFETVITSEMTASRRVWAFAQAADGAIWMATEHGLLRWTKDATKLYQQADGLPTDRLRALAFDRKGVLWIATTNGLVSFADGHFKVLNPANGFPHLQVRSVLADPKGGVWAATAGGGLAHVDGDEIKVYGLAEGLPTDQLTALTLDARGDLWIGTWGSGVLRMRQDGDGVHFSSVSSPEGLAGSQIWSLQVDREGSVWVGTWVGGLNRLRNRAFVLIGSAEGLVHDNVRSVLVGRSNVMWVGTAGGGLNRIADGHITPLGRKEGLPTDEISSLHEDADGTLWIGTYTSGVVSLKPGQQGQIETFGVAEGLPGNEVRSVYRDSKGVLWVGTRSGLARFEGSGFVPVTAPGLPQEGISAILEDRSGTLWFGTTGQGLVQLRDGVFKTLTSKDGLVSNWIMALYEDKDSTLWIGTNGEGMNRLGKDGKIASIRTRDGLWDGLSQTILEDRQGYLWMTCNRGFYRVARADLDAFAQGRLEQVHSAGFGPGDALRSTTFAGGLQSAGAVDAAGRLWLPSSNGLVIVDPRHLPGLGTPPGVRIEDIVVDGASQAADAPVVLEPGTTALTIRYAATTLLLADRMRFHYRMKGPTRDWVDAGSSREVNFPELPHGRYQFEVEASTDGIRWQPAAPLSITVKPRFFQTIWFYCLAVIAFASLIAAGERWRTRRLLARQRDMERLVAQRTDELREANQHLSRLSFSDALTGLANRRRFNEALHDEWRRAHRQRKPLALVMADIDAFKRYNDLLGHLEGDRCLVEVAAVFAHAVRRAGDLAARYGGEEFVVLLPNVDYADALGVAEDLRAACEALAIPHPESPAGAVVTLSLGVACCVPGDGVAIESLISAADAALYRAKKEGRNRTVGDGPQAR
ncbi:two-component regulator propeller domain-containing protein [Paucibacter sp. R3-3]|uniref:diguanylate cyclase n=1 Tax=Roseateles agri TaxID=3098619 RepID=A0ABU5DHB2_9BURK|nr:two-component regulator propeller domain-containing protein [Paucibacter sp. R3-3]MDY0745667.1 two-component regulator propeller domain-containing protein [Paucibacter sp. R3-3]